MTVAIACMNNPRARMQWFLDVAMMTREVAA